MKFATLFDNLKTYVKKEAPKLLTGFAIGGLIGSVIAAWKAGPKAKKILEERRRDLQDVKPDDKEAKRAVTKETVKKMIPVVLPTFVMVLATGACIIGSHTVSSKRLAVLSAAYAISEKTVGELNDKMVEVLGEKKTRAVKDAIIQDKVGSTPKDELGNIIVPGNSTVWCKDLYSGRMFRSNAERIKQAIVALSYDLVSDMYVSLNDLYDKIDSPDLPRIPLGDDVGWNIDNVRDGKLPIVVSALLTDDGQPCLCVEYDAHLRSDFRNLH